MNNRRKGKKLAVELIKKGIILDYSYIISSAQVIDDFTRGFCDALDQYGFHYNLACIWYERELIKGIEAYIYPITRIYREPLDIHIEYNLFCFNIPDSINEFNLNDYVGMDFLQNNTYRYLSNLELSNTHKTPDLVRERREAYL